AASQDFAGSVKDALLAALTSPQFLFLIETSQSIQPEPLDGYELASKLSYFLWNSPPDASLLAAAQRGTLQQELKPQLARMIDDAKFQRFTREFARQWLSLDKLDVVEVDRNRFPNLTRDAKTHLGHEPVALLEHVIRHNLPVRDLVQSDYLLANEVTASYYGLGDRCETGFEFRPLAHDRADLGGLLSQAGILAGLSDGRESNPIKRGAWLARKIIAEPPADPPPNVPALPEENPEGLSLREKLERHRDQPGCAKCHAGIDPWGLPLEQFNAGGLLKSAAVDAEATLPDGAEVHGAADLKRYLADDRIDQVAFSVLKHLTIYATGRSLTYQDAEFLREHGAKLKPNGYRMRDMLELIVTSPLFLSK
ncbi:MAG: DUF1592 domain-containing protein, partial [Planctomycetales bacterium]|nr:DUF1592 domain-containing protein [Planctomycetales bacterium]